MIWYIVQRIQEVRPLFDEPFFIDVPISVEIDVPFRLSNSAIKGSYPSEGLFNGLTSSFIQLFLPLLLPLAAV